MHHWLIILAIALAGSALSPQVPAGERLRAPVTADEPPQLRALLEHGWATESGIGQTRNVWLATALYCEAAQLGSAEGYYRAGLIYLSGKHFPSDLELAAAFFSAASQLGHHNAANMLEKTGPPYGGLPPCVSIEQAIASSGGFDMERYVSELPSHKRRVADLIMKLAPRYAVSVNLALAVASVESNFEVFARSPKNAQGVMQLIPETAARFNVRNPFNAEQNIRGGLAYLHWLLIYFDGNLANAVAAYNAGEGAVEQYRGIPPYFETQAYVRRVLHYAGSLHQFPPDRTKHRAK